MELTDMSEAELEQYQAELRRLNAELIDAAAAGKFNRCGHLFEQIMKVQHAYGMLPSQSGFDVIRAELAALDKIPGRISGVSL